MFGYVRPYKPELLVKDYELYRSAYCGLCKQLGRDYGIFARLILSYDCTFFTAVCASVGSGSICVQGGRCVCNPLKRCVYCETEDDSQAKSAALCVIMFYYKLRDNMHDEGFLNRTGAGILSAFTLRWKKKAAKKYPDYEKYVSDMLNEQLEAESRPDCSVDAAAHPTAHMLSRIMRSLAKNDEQSVVYSQFGYFLGRWIYIIDAADDFDKDKKSGSFNPIVNKFADRQELTSKSDEVRGYCNGVLNQTMAQLMAAYNLMAIDGFGSVTDNIVNLGMPDMQRKVLFACRDEENASKRRYMVR